MNHIKKIAYVIVVCASALHATHKWCVVGGGPAGIVVVGLLLDLNVPGKDILWVDPEFNVGRMGQYYQTVPGNARTGTYVDFIAACQAFQACAPNALNQLKQYDPTSECQLSVIIGPLQDITHGLRDLVDEQQT